MDRLLLQQQKFNNAIKALRAKKKASAVDMAVPVAPSTFNSSYNMNDLATQMGDR